MDIKELFNRYAIPGSAKTLVLHGVDEIQESETA